MSRASVISPYQKFWGLTGLVAVSDGTVQFYLNESTSPATIYSDPDLTIEQTNPYPLDDGGRIQGDVYFAGALTMVVYDSTGGELYTIDNVTCFDPSAAFSDWNEFVEYEEGGANIVTGSDGNYYVSLQDNNLGHDPISDNPAAPVWWEQINFFSGTTASLTRLEAIAAITPANQAVIIANGTSWVGSTIAALAPNFLSGLGTTVNVTDPNADIDIAAGSANDSTNALRLTLAAGVTKRLDATWVTGTNQGGRASGVSLSINTWYHLFVVSVGGVIDCMFDTSVTCANGVSGNAVTHYRRIGSVFTNGSSQIIKYWQTGDIFTWDDVRTDINVATPAEADVSATLSTPLGVMTLAQCYATISATTSAAATVYVLLDETRQTSIAADATTSLFIIASNLTYATKGGGYAEVVTNTSSQIRYRFGYSTTPAVIGFLINTVGWVDSRGKNG